MVDHLENIHK